MNYLFGEHNFDKMRIYRRNTDLKMPPAEHLGIKGLKELRSAPMRNGQSIFTPRSLDDLNKRYGNLQERYRINNLKFELPHTAGERSDEWFEIAFDHLYERTNAVAQLFFGADVLNLGQDKSSPWKKGEFGSDFIRCASEVSQEVYPSGDWDALLLDPAQRVCLVTGVLSKILSYQVFSDLLWGAPEDVAELLKLHDEAIDSDGFIRSQQRCDLVRAVLKNKVVTEEFWDEVDATAKWTTELLLPLINLLGCAAPTREWPELPEIHQHLHNIIAEAAYISICVRRCRSIFHIEYPLGEVLDVVKHQEVNPGLFIESTQNAEEGQLHGAVPSALLSEQWGRTSKVKIVAWPLITRHKPLGEIDTFGRGASGGGRESCINKSRVVYGSGGLGNDIGDPWATLEAQFGEKPIEGPVDELYNAPGDGPREVLASVPSGELRRRRPGLPILAWILVALLVAVLAVLVNPRSEWLRNYLRQLGLQGLATSVSSGPSV